ncbi:hypothetical protein BHM03_00033512 [Ensete ventricosum]|uniref:Uncharacterized protein n=1 Tax=Ensete ventricosum TaxID=4639 RepID=A0A445MIV2_ENSVE|nr:hypothetical protein BHM03_00033512 [Ensete ventricosum]
MIYIFFLQLACVKHFSMEPLSFLGIDVCDENEVILYLLLYSCIQKFSCFELLEAHNRGKDCKNSRDDLGEGLSDLRKLLKAWSSVILVHGEVRELQSVVKSSNSGNNLKERQIDCHK